MKLLFKSSVIALVFILIWLKPIQATTTTSFPETAPGKLMSEWSQLFNAGDRDKLEAFIAAHYSSELLHGRSPAEITAGQLGLKESSGRLELSKVEKSAPAELVAIFRSTGVLPQFVRVAWQVEDNDPNRIRASSISPTSAPASDDLGKLPVNDLGKDLDGKLEELTRLGQFSGAALIAKDGKPVWQKAFGLADREHKLPATLATRFRLGSMNKMFTSVAIAQLVQAGKLHFTDTIADVLPDYPNKDVARKVTIHQLLTHTSGLGDIFGPKFREVKDTACEIKDYLPLFVSEPLRFEPGKGWSYSNAGFIVLGLIIEKVSGESYYDYIQHHVYDKAAMKSSGNIPKTERVPAIAVGYMKPAGGLQPNWETLPCRGMSAGGGDSTVGDLLNFANALRSFALVSPELTETITTGKVDPAAGSPEKYAYGFADKQVNGRRVVGHGGGAPGMNAELSILWDSGYTVVVLSNLDPPSAQNVTAYILQRLPD